MGLDTLGTFSTIFTRETTFLYLCFPANEVSSERGSTLKGKNLLGNSKHAQMPLKN